MEKEIDIRDVIILIKKIIQLIKRKIVFLFIIGLLGGALGYFYAYSVKTKYSAVITFLDNEESATGIGAYLKMAKTLGVMGGRSGNAGKSAEQLLEIIESKKIMGTALLKEVTIDNKKDLLIRHFLRLLGLNEVYSAKFKCDYSFNKSSTDPFLLSDIDGFVMNKVCKILAKTLVKDNSLESGIITVSYDNLNEEFAKYFLDELILSLEDFYVRNKIQREQEMYDLLSNRLDSVKNELEKTENYLAQIKDSRHTVIKATGHIDELRGLRKQKILTFMYLEGVKNLEMARVSLLEKKPFIQIIDEPVFPLLEIKKSKKKYTVIFGVLFGVLGFSFLIIRIIWRKNS